MVQTRNVGGVEIAIRGDNSQFKREMRKTKREARRTGQDVSRSFDKADRSVSRMNRSIMASRTSMLALGAAAGVALTSATRVIAGFEQAMSTVSAVTGATEAQFAALTDKARELGATTRFSATQAADGMTFLARAGFDVDSVLGSIEGTLQLAQAGNLGLADAADIASNVLQGMQLDVDQTARAVDVLALSANSSNTDVRQLGDALKYVAPISSGLGVSLEETTAAIGALSDAGLQGEMAGTGLRKVMISLEKQSNQGLDILAKYGLTLDDVRVSSVGLTPALTKLAEAGITTGEAMTLFGLRGGPAFEVLSTSIPKVERMTGVLGDAGGTANRVATIMDDNLNGAILRARSALEELILAMGEAGATAALEAAFTGLADLLRVAAENADILAVAFVALSARALLPFAKTAVAAAATALVRLNALVNLSVLAFGRLGGAAAITGAAMSAIAGPTLVILAAAAAYVTLARNAKSAQDQLQEFEGTMSRISSVNQQIANDTKELDGLNRQLTEAIRNQSDAAESAARIEIDALNTRIAKNKELRQVYESLARAQLAGANASLADQRDQVARRLDQQLTGGLGGFTSASVDSAREEFLARVRSQQEAGQELSPFSRQTLQMIADLDRLEVEAKSAREAVEALGAPIEASTESVSEITASAGSSGLSGASGGNAEADRLKEVLALEFQLDLARAQGDEAEIARLEDKLDIIARTQDLVRAGVDITEAEIEAREQVNALREAENEILRKQFEARRDAAVRESLGGAVTSGAPAPSEPQADEIIDYTSNRLRDGLSDALFQAVQGQDWQDALGRTFYEVINDNMRDAFDDVLDYLGDALKGVLSGSSGNAIGDIFGGIGGFFAGNRASGGSVSGGNRYLIGERGPEMFIPTSDGYVVSNEDLKAGGRVGKVSGGGVGAIRMGDINVHGDPSGRTLELIRQAQAEQARQLPSLIDQRVQESSTRGRYG